MKKVIRLTESDLTRIIKRVLNEQSQTSPIPKELQSCLMKIGFDSSQSVPSCIKLYIMGPPTDLFDVEGNMERVKLGTSCGQELGKLSLDTETQTRVMSCLNSEPKSY